MTSSGLCSLKYARIDVGREHPDVALGEIRQQLRRMLQRWKAEEGCNLSATGGHVHGAEAQLDFRLGLLDILGVGAARQILMRPGVGAERHAGCQHLLGDLRMPSPMLADLEEGRFEAFACQRLDHGGGVAGPGPVVERQHDFLVAEEVILLEMLEAEAWTTRGVDLHDARQAHAARLVARRNGGHRRRGLRLC